MVAIYRAKKVTDPLDDEARSRLFGTGDFSGYLSSGSEHSRCSVDDSHCLLELVHGFLQENDPEAKSPSKESDADRVESTGDSREVIEKALRRCFSGNADPYKNLLSVHVAKAVEAFSSLRLNKPMFRRNVMSFLREIGYNAGICKTKWDSSGGLTGGNYEFIDVVGMPSSNRYFIDLDFAAEFEIARPTVQYSSLLKLLPRAYVGKSEELKTIVTLMGEEAGRSLKSRGLTVPPWRKNRYMQNKWFGAYRRTTNATPAGASPPSIAVKCRIVGFDNNANGRMLVHTR